MIDLHLTKRKAVVIFVLSVFVTLSVLAYRTTEETMHELWLEKGNPFPVEKEFTIITLVGGLKSKLEKRGWDSDGFVVSYLNRKVDDAYHQMRSTIPKDDASWVEYWTYLRLTPHVLTHTTNGELSSVDPAFLSEAYEAFESLKSYPTRAKHYNEIGKHKSASLLFPYLIIGIAKSDLPKEKQEKWTQAVTAYVVDLILQVDPELYSQSSDHNSRPAIVENAMFTLKVLIESDLLDCQRWAMLEKVLPKAELIYDLYSQSGITHSKLEELQTYISKAKLKLHQNSKGNCHDRR